MSAKTFTGKCNLLLSSVKTNCFGLTNSSLVHPWGALPPHWKQTISQSWEGQCNSSLFQVSFEKKNFSIQFLFCQCFFVSFVFSSLLVDHTFKLVNVVWCQICLHFLVYFVSFIFIHLRNTFKFTVDWRYLNCYLLFGNSLLHTLVWWVHSCFLSTIVSQIKCWHPVRMGVIK